MKLPGAGAGALLGPGGLLAGALPGFEDRPQQRAMADAVETALCGGDPHPLMVEAGTGTGKTLAYLLPAALSGRKVIISTGTRALQEQLTRHDIPLAEKALGRPIASAVLKGVSNYVCRRRAGQLGLARISPELDSIRAWLLTTETGDRAEMGELGEDSAWWQELTTTPEGRLGPKCPHHEACFVTRARRAAEKADLIVVNHHLFFADLALRGSAPGARVLPDYDAVVFDEAHLLEDVMTEHFGFGVSTVKLGLLARELGGRGVPSEALQRSAADFFGEVTRQLGGALRETRVALPDGLFADAALQAAWFGLDGALEAAEVRCAAAAEDEDEPDEVREEWAALSRRGAALRAALADLAEGDGGGGGGMVRDTEVGGTAAAARVPRFVKWAEARMGQVYLKAAPIDVSRILGERVLSGVPAAVMTSATLTCAGSFRYLRDRLGLGPDACDELRVDSPFDYSRQALLYVARDLPEPNHTGFGEAACQRIAELVRVTGGGAFALFTSHRALREAERRLPGLIGDLPILVQGQAPPAVLLERFRAREGAVLLATGTFWAGVDVPGPALRLVIMDKLPFASPGDPLGAARADALAARGGDPFRELSLPAAALTFRQGFGRLIRRGDDRGIAAVLDGRIVGKRYGASFLESLPRGLRRTASLEQVRRFWVGPDHKPAAAPAQQELLA